MKKRTKNKIKTKNEGYKRKNQDSYKNEFSVRVTETYLYIGIEVLLLRNPQACVS